jgi:hypothetical protein
MKTYIITYQWVMKRYDGTIYTSPLVATQKTRDHKQASIFVEFTDVFRLTENSETHVHAAAIQQR